MTQEVYWRPRHAGNLMAVPFLGDGVTPGNIAVLHDARTFKSLAIVINTHQCRTVEPGDIILFKEGQYEELADSRDDLFYYMEEKAIVLVLHNLSLESDRPIYDSSTNPVLLR